MSGACVALALETALDIAAIRRLHDYGDLDDAGVTSAFEHMHMQRSGHLQVPAYLTAITQAAAVVDEAGDVRIAQFEAEPDEAALLQALTQRLPRQVETIVSWDGRAAASLGVRVFLHEQPIGETLRKDAELALADCLAPRADDFVTAATDQEAEIVRLAGLPDTMDAPTYGNRAVATAVNRYRLWLRWQASRGAIDPDARSARGYALAAAVENTGTIRA